MNISPQPSSRTGFSLVELLVSIAVVAILAAVIVASVASVQRKARAMDCHAKLRTIGVGVAGYLQDKGYYPGLCIDNWPRLWFHAIGPYVTGESMPNRSADIVVVPEWMQCKERDLHSGRRTHGFSYNQFFSNFAPDDTPASIASPFTKYWHVKPAMVENPLEKVVIGESYDATTETSFSIHALHNGDSINNTHRARRHPGGGHYLFADGHVDWISAPEMARRLQQDNKRIFKPYVD